MDKDHKKQLLIDGMPIAIAIVALLVSFRGCSISDEAIKLAKLDSQSSQAIVLVGDVSEKKDEIIFRPLSDDMKIITLIVNTPSRLLLNKAEFSSLPILDTEPPGTWTYLNGLKKVITTHHLKEQREELPRGKLPSKSYTVARAPVMIQTSYLVKGTRLYDTSVYHLKYIFYHEVDQEGKTKSTGVVFTDVEFFWHFTPHDVHRITKDLSDGKGFMLSFNYN